MSLQRPALDPQSLEPHTGCGYPEPYRSRVLPREVRRVGDALGHTHEDEFVYVLEGELLLRTDAGEQPLGAGMCAGFPAGSRDGHQLVNRGTRTAVYLVVSNRDPEDIPYYTDGDVDLSWSAPHARGRMTRRDGTPY